MMFEEFVYGKRIAVVGPAIPVGDQSAAIDEHDLVYRLAQRRQPIPEYGTRTDIIYLNGLLGRRILDDDMRDHYEFAKNASWWVYKTPHGRQERPHGKQRMAIKPAIRNENAITGVLWDLVQFPVGSITVYGTDLFAAGPKHSYHPLEQPDGATPEQLEWFVLHRPFEQLRTHRAIVRTGKIVGDDRYLAAATMTDAEYQLVVDEWEAAYQAHKAAEPALT